MTTRELLLLLRSAPWPSPWLVHSPHCLHPAAAASSKNMAEIMDNSIENPEFSVQSTSILPRGSSLPLQASPSVLARTSSAPSPVNHTRSSNRPPKLLTAASSSRRTLYGSAGRPRSAVGASSKSSTYAVGALVVVVEVPLGEEKYTSMVEWRSSLTIIAARDYARSLALNFGLDPNDEAILCSSVFSQIECHAALLEKHRAAAAAERYGCADVEGSQENGNGVSSLNAEVRSTSGDQRGGEGGGELRRKSTGHKAEKAAKRKASSGAGIGGSGGASGPVAAHGEGAEDAGLKKGSKDGSDAQRYPPKPRKNKELLDDAPAAPTEVQYKRVTKQI